MEAPPRTRPPRRLAPRRPSTPLPVVDRHEPPTTDENAAGEHVGRSRRLHPAGHALLVGVLALLLGALLNAPGLRKTAETQNPGWKRDVGMALTKPLLAVSQTLYLDRPRAWLKDAMGRSDDDRIETGPIVAPPPPPATTPPASRLRPPPPATTTPRGGAKPAGAKKPSRGAKKPAVAPPPKPAFSPQRPLRVYVGGDSLAITPGYALFSAMGGSKVYKAVTVAGGPDGHVSSGLERPDFYDWFGRIRDVMREDRPKVVVVLFGGNDDHSYMTGTPAGVDGNAAFGSPEWVREYRRRVGIFMDTVIREGGFVVWLGLPIVRSESLSQHYRLLNRIYEQEARRRPKGAAFLDLYDLFEDPRTGGYSQFRREADGELVPVRSPDGVHFQRAGGDVIAREVLRILNQRFDLTSWKRKQR